MDVINKLKSTITNVITGNPLVGEFEILEQRASGGPGMLWKVHNGIKRSTKQAVSIFLLEKKLLERYSRRDREFTIDVLKKGITQLTKLRHPKILSVLHPVEESRDCLAFATEPVFMSLANILGQFDNLPSPIPSDMRDFKLYDVEIKYGLLHLTEALSFLHNDVKMVHNGICPQSVFVNQSGAWKLAGFDYAIPNANQQDQSPFFKFHEWQGNLPSCTQPSLNYLAPEYTLTRSCDTAADMYSLGILLYAIFNSGKSLFDCRGEWTAFKRNAEELKRLKISILGAVPGDARDHVKMLLNADPTVRPDADQISKIPFFEDVGAMTLQYLDTLVQRDNLQRSQFFKGLPKILGKMPKRVCVQQVLSCLFTECTNSNMVPFVLPSILQIGEHCSEREFAAKILPGLVPLFRLHDPIQVQPQTWFQITLVFLQNMSLILSKTPQNDIKNHVLPMVYRALERDGPQIQEMCLHIIPTFANLIEYSQMKSALVPRIKKLCLGTSTLRLRVNCLLCLGKLLEYMDKWYVLDEILPILAQIPSREPAVLMSMLGIYQVALTHKKLGMTKEIMAAKVLPFLIPLSIDNNLNLQQFNAYNTLVKDMLQKVETEHRAKLEQLDSMQQEQRTLQQFAEESIQDGDMKITGGATSGSNDTMMDKFLSSMGLGSFLAPAASNTDKSPTGNHSNALGDLDASDNRTEQSTNKPVKTNLTLEEKQRLAKDQEQNQRLKQQPSLTPRATPTPRATTAPASKPQVKDLTATLMSTDFMSTQTTRGPMSSGSVFGGNTGPSMMTSPTLESNFGSSYGMPGGTSFNSGGMDSRQQQPQNKQMNMSSLDNLLPMSNQNKVPMGPMANQKASSPGSFGQPPPQQGMMGNAMGGQRPMGNMGMMGNMGTFGSQPPMGGQPGMMGNPGMGGSSFSQGMYRQNTPNQSNGQVKQLSQQDLQDFLG